MDGGLTRSGQEGMVKSGARVLDVFDFLSHVQRPAREVEIRNALALPKSSTNDLLKTMVGRGYLAFDVLDRTYAPSYRLARFGKMVDSLDADGHGLSDLIAGIRSRVGEAVLLSEPLEARMQVVAIDTDDEDARRNFCAGKLLDIVTSASGRAYLMTRSERDIRWIARRNARFRPQEKTPQAIGNIVSMVRQFAELRYASSMQSIQKGPSLTVAMPLPPRPNRASLMLAVGGPIERMEPRIDAVTQCMRSAIAKHFGTDAAA